MTGGDNLGQKDSWHRERRRRTLDLGVDCIDVRKRSEDGEDVLTGVVGQLEANLVVTIWRVSRAPSVYGASGFGRTPCQCIRGRRSRNPQQQRCVLLASRRDHSGRSNSRLHHALRNNGAGQTCSEKVLVLVDGVAAAVASKHGSHKDDRHCTYTAFHSRSSTNWIMSVSICPHWYSRQLHCKPGPLTRARLDHDKGFIGPGLQPQGVGVLGERDSSRVTEKGVVPRASGRR